MKAVAIVAVVEVRMLDAVVAKAAVEKVRVEAALAKAEAMAMATAVATLERQPLGIPLLLPPRRRHRVSRSESCPTWQGHQSGW